MVDKTSNVSNKEQAIFCVCWVDENLFSYEDFLELHETEKTNVISIKNVIKDTFVRLGFESKKFWDDGCATMMGNKKGIATQIKNDIQPLALSIYCNVHSLNLACGDGIRNAADVSKSLDTSYEITKLVNFSTNRDSHLRKIHVEEYYKNEKNYIGKFKIFRLFSGTRRRVTTGSLTSIYKNYQELLEELWHLCLMEYKD